MTREGIHTQLSIEIAAKREVNPHDVADAIYDDFESRTCENCMYAEDKSFQQRECNKIEMYVDKDFGCNEWKAIKPN